MTDMVIQIIGINIIVPIISSAVTKRLLGFSCFEERGYTGSPRINVHALIFEDALSFRK